MSYSHWCASWWITSTNRHHLSDDWICAICRGLLYPRQCQLHLRDEIWRNFYIVQNSDYIIAKWIGASPISLVYESIAKRAKKWGTDLQLLQGIVVVVTPLPLPCGRTAAISVIDWPTCCIWPRRLTANAIWEFCVCWLLAGATILWQGWRTRMCHLYESSGWWMMW